LAILFFIALFAGVLIYAFWPCNKMRFEEASKLPLEDYPAPKTKKDD
jgi:cytochrome c oxidase cbb3-type subunit 4